MANKVTFTMNNVPAGLDSMYVRVEEDALTAGVRNVLHSGVQAVTGNTIDIDIGENGTVGNGAIISADNYTSGGAAFKSMAGYALIEAGDNLTTDTWVLNLSGSDVITTPDPILIPAGQPVSAFFRVIDTSAPRVLWSAVDTPRSYVYLSGWTVSGESGNQNIASIKVDGFDTNTFPDDGNMHKVEVIYNKDVWLDRFGLSHANIFNLTGQIRDINYNGESFAVNDNAQTIEGSLSTVLSLTGGNWEQYGVQDV